MKIAPLLLLAAVACGGPFSSGSSSSSLESAVSAPGPAAAASATVVVHYPAGWGHHISLRGSGGGLSWSRGTDARWSAGDEWRLSLPLAGAAQLKPLFDDAAWAIGPNWTLAPGQTLDVWPHFFNDAGTLTTRDGWWSNRLQNARTIWVYLPPSYAENAGERFPVVYMHDGQNLFVDSASFSGVSWNVAGAMDLGARDGTIHEAIVIGVDNNGDRLNEYTPVADPQYGGGNAGAYLGFLADELKPAIDSQYRTLSDRGSTAIIGSSLGGLASAYAGLARAETFGLIGVMSPSTWWDNDWIIGAVAGTRAVYQKPVRAYVDSGDSGPSSDDLTQTAQLAQAYRGIGWVQVGYVVQKGGQHGEEWWRERVPGALGFLLGAR